MNARALIPAAADLNALKIEAVELSEVRLSDVGLADIELVDPGLADVELGDSELADIGLVADGSVLPPPADNDLSRTAISPSAGTRRSSLLRLPDSGWSAGAGTDISGGFSGLPAVPCRRAEDDGTAAVVSGVSGNRFELVRNVMASSAMDVGEPKRHAADIGRAAKRRGSGQLTGIRRPDANARRQTFSSLLPVQDTGARVQNRGNNTPVSNDGLRRKSPGQQCHLDR